MIITDVQGDSDAGEKGLRAGLVIEKAGKKGAPIKRVTTAEEFASAVADAGGSKIVLRVLLAGGRRRFITISPK